MASGNFFIYLDIKILTANHSLEIKNALVGRNGVLHFATHDEYTFLVAGSTAAVAIMANPPIKVRAVIVREITRYGEFWNLRFTDISRESRTHLDKIIETFGVKPQWARKFPRIPSTEELQHAPLEGTMVCGSYQMTAKIRDISIGGIRMETSDSENAAKMAIGYTAEIFISQRDPGKSPIIIKGVLVRISEDYSEADRAKIFSFGVQFKEFEPDEKVTFLEMIKNICLELKK